MDQLPPPPPQKKKYGQYEGEMWDEFFTRWVIRWKQQISAESLNQRESRMYHAMDAESKVCLSSNRTRTTVFIWIEVDGDWKRSKN